MKKLRNYPKVSDASKVEFIFWAWNQKYGEPDLILIFKNHINGDEDFLLVKENVFHLRWNQLCVIIEKMKEFYSSFEKPIVDDLRRYMEKVGLRDFSGISLPDESLSLAFLSPYQVFYKLFLGYNLYITVNTKSLFKIPVQFSIDLS